ncbi:flavin reductase family protein [Eubacteriales bacterium OttesenSCG-928-K08]|nr:flavin reductase family protein [Eubacteriales bacterium OttesenSCG-928-K08]
MSYDEKLLALASRQLFEGGAFLMSGLEEQNPMTIGWAQFGRVWGLPMCTVFVRHSRHSFKLMEKDDVFTVSFPLDGAMKKELGFCGTNSGRDTDKKAQIGAGVVPARAGAVAGLAGCKLHVECRLRYKLDMVGHMEPLYEGIRDEYYKPGERQSDNGDPHMLYFGEILDVYEV